MNSFNDPTIHADVMSRLAGRADQAAVAAEQASQTPAPTLVQMAEELATLTTEIGDLDAQLKALKERRDQLRKVAIPDAMRAAGMVNGTKGSFTFPGGSVYLETRTYVSIKDGEQPAAFAWLRAHDQGDVIKETVNASSLSAIVRELMEADGGNFSEPACLSIHPETVAKVKVSKTAKR